MNSIINRIRLAYLATRRLGPKTIWYYGLYQAGLKTGYLRLRTQVAEHPIQAMDANDVEISDFQPNFFLSVPSKDTLNELLGSEGSNKVLEEAEEILQGRVRLFGADAVQMCLKPADPIQHWSLYSEVPGEDLKFTWEPARFTWVYTLGRAYLLSGDERFPLSFYQYFASFLTSNPTNGGPNWISGQEIALRILAFVFAWQVFSDSPASTPGRIKCLKEAIQTHARRIPSTLYYARAQNNNHLLTEAAGLFTAGVCLGQTPEAASWRNLGWKWFNWAVQNQIAMDGTYIQHSTNYHRLMLQTALWMQAAAKKQKKEIPPRTMQLLGPATNWLMGHYDPISGQASNLGHNDGSNILPLATGAFSDYRPVIQAAACAFLKGACLPSGAWDELSVWLGCANLRKYEGEPSPNPADAGSAGNPALLGMNPMRLGNAASWAALQSVTFTDRPAHADQLQADLWWHGYNIALDAGTYRYTASEPWQNALMDTMVHNTIQVDGQNQMLRSGRFLWLNWAQAKRLPEIENEFTRAAEHDGYQNLGVKHLRTLTWVENNEWLIRDRLIPIQTGAGSHKAVLNWLLQDWPWKITENNGTVSLQLQTPDSQELNIQVGLEESLQIHQTKINSVRLIRAGQVVYGQPGNLATLGWFSPTYNVKLPALSFQIEFVGKPPFTFTTFWTLPSLE
ncbi:MAG: alginate lyase family protein [Anaerolineaceae bacterium]|nr:alginate lyase family protein [Anaerolineaceae bacterium]